MIFQNIMILEKSGGFAGSCLGFAQPVSCTLWGMAALDSLRSLLSFFYSPRSSLWSPLSFPLVTNIYPLSHQGPFPLVIKVPLLHLHSFEVKCDKRTKNKRRTNELTDRTESRTMAVISIDVCKHYVYCILNVNNNLFMTWISAYQKNEWDRTTFPAWPLLPLLSRCDRLI